MSHIYNFALATAIITMPLVLIASPDVAEAGITQATNSSGTNTAKSTPPTRTPAESKANEALASARVELNTINTSYLAARETYLARETARNEAARILEIAINNLTAAERLQAQAALVYTVHKNDKNPSEREKAAAFVAQATADLLKAQQQRNDLELASRTAQAQLDNSRNTLTTLGAQLNLLQNRVNTLTVVAATAAAQAHLSSPPPAASVAGKIANGDFDAVKYAVPNNSPNGDIDISYLDLRTRSNTASRDLATSTGNPVREAVAAYLTSVYIHNTRPPTVNELQAQIRSFTETDLKNIVNWYLHHTHPTSPVVIAPTTPPAVSTNTAQPPTNILSIQPSLPSYESFLAKELPLHVIGQVLNDALQQKTGYKDASDDDSLPCVDDGTTFVVLNAAYYFLNGAAALGEAQRGTKFNFHHHPSLVKLHDFADYLSRDGRLNQMSRPTKCSHEFTINSDLDYAHLDPFRATTDNFGNRADSSRSILTTNLPVNPNKPYEIDSTWTTQIHDQDTGQWPTELSSQEQKKISPAVRKNNKRTNSHLYTPKNN